MSKHERTRVLPTRIHLIVARYVLASGLIMQTRYATRNYNGNDELETTMLMTILQINLNYFDRQFPHPQNCPFERQVSKGKTEIVK